MARAPRAQGSMWEQNAPMSSSESLQLLLTNIISITSTFINFIGFYIIIVQKSKESRKFVYVQLTYQVLLYLSQFFMGTVLNTVFLFPIPGLYCIGWLRELTELRALFAFIMADIFFSLQGLFLTVIIVMKVGAVARPRSPFKMSPTFQTLFLCVFVLGSTFSQVIVIIFSYSDRPKIDAFLTREHPDFKYVLRYPFLWMITTSRHFIAFIFTIFACIGASFLIFIFSYIILLVELDLQVKQMSKATNQYNRKVVKEIVVHTLVTLPFFIGVPLSIFMKFFLDSSLTFSFSIPTVLCFALFTSAPIPSMLIFLLRNPLYRDFLLKLFLLKKAPLIKTSTAPMNLSRVSVSRVEV